MIIAAFEGWNDAGEAASGVITHLSEAWHAAPVGAIDPEDFYDFQVTRPVTEVTDGKTQRLIWPTTRLLKPTQNRIDRDVLLVHRMFGSMPWTSTTSRPIWFCVALSSRVVGQIRRCDLPSVTSVTGRVTWKS